MANNLDLIRFVTRERGVVLYLGMGNWADYPIQSGSIWSSIDGGKSWSKVLPNGYTAFAATSESFVVAGGQDGRFARSHDAGCSWIEESISIEGNLTCLSAWDSSNIVVATDAPAVLWSEDGGKMWREIALPEPGFEVVDLIATGPGQMWILQKPRESKIRESAYHLWLVRSDRVGSDRSAESDWLSAESHLRGRSLCYTENYGRSWITSDQVPEWGRRTKLFAYDRSAAVAGHGCMIRAEEDGGRMALSQSSASMQIFDVSKSGTTVMGGYHQYGYLTIQNATEGWRRDNTIADNGIIDACLLDDTHGWAIAGSYGGNMPWISEDGGATWTRLPKKTVYRGMEGITSPFSED